MLWVATDSAGVVKVATPLPLSVPVPSVVAPSLNVTVPLGVPAPEVTVAVNVTLWPKTDGLAELVNAVVVLAALTTWVRMLEVLVVKSVSPA